MNNLTFTKGIYTAKVATRPIGGGKFQGVVSLERDDAQNPETSVYEVNTASASEPEALDEAKALAHRILGEIEL